MKPGDLVFMAYDANDSEYAEPEMGLIINYIMHNGSISATDEDLHMYEVLVGDIVVHLFEHEMVVIDATG